MKRVNQLINIGYLAFYGSPKSIKSFRVKAEYAKKVGIQLCLIEITLKNIKEIKAKGKESIIEIRIWNGKSIEEHSVLLPLIIYDRINPNNTGSNTDLIYQALVCAGCYFLNSLGLRRLASDKWEQYVFFSVRGVKTPYTKKFGIQVLAEFLNKGRIFIKPRAGSLGKNQIIISHQEDNKYNITTTFGRKKTVLIKDYKGVTNFLKAFDLTHYIIQEGIDIDQIEEPSDKGIRFRTYDFRVIVQRNSLDKISVPLIYIRVGAIGSSQANISRGGHAQDPKSVFVNHKIVINQLKEEGTKIFFMLEEKYSISEIGLDFLCDKKGDYWLIEINSRPGTQGPRELRELVFSDVIKRNSRIVFDEEYSNKQRKRWGRSFNAFCINPFKFAKEIYNKKF